MVFSSQYISTIITDRCNDIVFKKKLMADNLSTSLHHAKTFNKKKLTGSMTSPAIYGQSIKMSRITN